MQFMKHLTVAALAAGMAMSVMQVRAADSYKIDISLETGPNHVRNKAMNTWAEYLQDKSAGRLKVRVFHGASKYKGSNVPKALGQGALDMGAPGHWHLGKYVADFGLLFLPAFYGASREQIYAVMDGPIGKELNAKIEKKLKVKVIGRHFDLGYGTMFFTKKAVTSHKDISGLKMRVPGGAANLRRFETFDASAIKVSWPDVPQALQRGMVDGVLTTYESVRSAKLWDSGLRHSFDDYQAYFQYVPMMSLKAWNRLPKDLQDLVVTSWEEQVDPNRKTAEMRQASAKAAGVSHGIKTNAASAAGLAAMRAKLLMVQPGIIEALRMDVDFVARAQAAVDKVK
ncbi:MAG: TRAP transporter substrate-binding protein DctP [Rhodospirillaceae bacterium]|jgi:C4-dicarboxylate-binding protein DctP|nr:TRAP transporter substrate-binding protein DctP [Rhodospirillaceae bacterium]MBT4689765.1 TRAP transporter substrate-binding protein DctP [Rhodospirillaceae bacterium]MBT5080143.1 TRAP transporter substrate-binding protein DctP [Rhodospirillaceae bacterium]MBT5526401.1 TRAP transporter substrate-binding protein DctP [Rhodospirillaceae bacterium]MBT5877939.1 TRAP transporter substrate-binding protein DctP [Rhodospirillaceae bacterium]